MTKNKLNSIVLCTLLSLFVFSCTSNDIYFKYQSVATSGWSKDSLYTFDVHVKDTNAAYNIYLNIRNRGEYPYQNLWMFLQLTGPDSLNIKDSVECYLADQRGKWLGSGTGSVYEMPVLYQQNYRFKKSGLYQFKIAQGMRDTILEGVNDVGVRIEVVK